MPLKREAPGSLPLEGVNTAWRTRAQNLRSTPDYEKVLYTPERVHKWMKGELTLRELMAYNGPEMLQMAIMELSCTSRASTRRRAPSFTGCAI